MATAGQYRVGPSDFFTPGDLAADGLALLDQAEALDATLESSGPGITVSWMDSWNAWLAKYKAFYRDHFDGWFSSFATALNDSNRDELVSFEKQFEVWAQQAAEKGSSLPDASRIGPRAKSGDSLDNHLDKLGLPSLNSLSLLLGVVVSGYIIWQASK